MKIILLFFILVVNSLIAAEGPQQVVEKIFSLASKPELVSDKKLQSELESYVDFDQMALTTLGSSISKVPASEQGWYKQTLKEIITKTVYPKSYNFLNKVKISYMKPKLGNDRASVNSIVRNRAQETDVTYMFVNKNGWKIVDIALDDESWVEGIQRDVVAVIKKDGYLALKTKLTKRLAELNVVKK